MSIDVLQSRIRQYKNPSAVIFAPVMDFLPPSYDRSASGMGDYCCDLLFGLKELIPAVRVDFSAFALLGDGGLDQLRRVMLYAKELGYYVILDWLVLEKAGAAADHAKQLLANESYPFDGITLCAYAGSECIKPYISASAKQEQDVFVVLKTANKSGMEVQDLQTGGRLVYLAVADLLNSWGESVVGRFGFSRISAMAGATSADSLRVLRKKYPGIFLIVDGLDVSGANARNASEAFNSLGYGAVCCAGSSVLGAWKESEGTDPIQAAITAVERMKRNITRYVTVL